MFHRLGHQYRVVNDDSVSDTKKSDVELSQLRFVRVVCLQLLTPGFHSSKGRVLFTFGLSPISCGNGALPISWVS